MIHIRRLLWDDWNVAHIAQHAVTPEEVEEVCHGDFLLLLGKKGRMLLLGPTRVRRMLAVVLDHEGEGSYYPVTARPASRKERRRYREYKEGRCIYSMTQTTQKKSRIPEFTSREEEAAFWDTHDMTDYWDEFEVVEAKDVTVEKNLSTGITVRLTPTLLRRLRQQAKDIGVGPSTLARMWIIDHLKEMSRETPRTPA